MAKHNLKDLESKLIEKIKQDKKQIELIAEECAKYDFDIKEVFERAEIPVVTIYNWRTKEPNAFNNLKSIHKTMDIMKEEKIKKYSQIIKKRG